MSVYNLFISHSWSYDDYYNRLLIILNNQISTNFNYKNYSVPKDDPIHNAPTDKLLRAAINNQMRPASCILILAGVYATYSKWINIEIEIAQSMDKRIIAIEPWDSKKTSTVVKKAAQEIVGWNGAPIVRAIRGW